MGKKTSEVMAVFMKMKIEGKSVLYKDLLRVGFHRAHIENAINHLALYGYKVSKDVCNRTSVTKLSVQ